MPTAAKLAAALLFALLGALGAELAKQSLPPEIRTQWLTQTSAGLGFVVGWFMVGPRAGRGLRAASGLGATAAAVMAVLGLLGGSAREMLDRAVHMRYHHVGEAMQDVIMIAITYGGYVLTPQFIALGLIGGMIGGLITEAVGRRWQ